ncbi:hypothetical protein [Vreelandella neptunia]|uniref:Uncharacterized protein n=1 Tax=Vreelandella neptunia TaxID=115551 RepID=A0ABS9S7Q4_9GAMM|nr:hypothetical protein [Halomonas neptunia]MCH4812104.1 hypothetical protein [Halomonas neptunia]
MMTPEQEYITIVYAKTDYDQCPLITPGYLYEVIDEDFEMGTFRTCDGVQVWKKDGDIGFQDWERITQEEEIPPGVARLGLSEEKIRTVCRILRDVKEDIENLDRKEKEAEKAAFEYYFAMGPRISLGEQLEPTDHVAAFAEFDAGSYDAAKIIAAELLEKGEPLPERLASFVAKVLRGMERPKPLYKGKTVRDDTDLRDDILVYALWRLERLGINAGHNMAKGHRKPRKTTVGVYGCQLVAQAIKEVMSSKDRSLKYSTLQTLYYGEKGQEIKSWYDILPE